MPQPFELATIEQLTQFDTLIDVRSPGEFAIDHLPGAINCPVLSDKERELIGTVYKQISPFEARRQGAILIARNIAYHLETQFRQQHLRWKPLIYCWRGGQRSGAMMTVFRQIGWQAKQLIGGYKGWRKHVIHELDHLPEHFNFFIIAGKTGSGKSKILQILRSKAQQVLDLEALAHHKGSVFGCEDGIAQPSQKFFETSIYAELKNFNHQKPVFIEAESRRIGKLYLPDSIIKKIQTSPLIEIAVPVDERIRYLQHDYSNLLHNAELIKNQVFALKEFHSKVHIQHWLTTIDNQDWPNLIAALLHDHYDPLYNQRSHLKRSIVLIEMNELSNIETDKAADQIIGIAASEVL